MRTECGRLIDADALIEKYGDWYVEEGTETGFIGTLESLLDGQPTINRVNVTLDEEKIDRAVEQQMRAIKRRMRAGERKKGKWFDAVVGGELPVIACDQCNTFFPLQFGASHNYCPNCGADMRQGGEEP